MPSCVPEISQVELGFPFATLAAPGNPVEVGLVKTSEIASSILLSLHPFGKGVLVSTKPLALTSTRPGHLCPPPVSLLLMMCFAPSLLSRVTSPVFTFVAGGSTVNRVIFGSSTFGFGTLSPLLLFRLGLVFPTLATFAPAKNAPPTVMAVAAFASLTSRSS